MSFGLRKDSVTETGVESERDNPSASARRIRPIRPLWVVLAVMSVLVVAGLVVWQQTASRWRADVTAGYAATLRCAGTTVHQTQGVPFVTLRPGLRCILSLRVSNNGPHGVHIDTLTLPFMGADTGAQLRAHGPGQGVATGGRDALFHLDRDVSAHASFVVSYQLRFWPGGCIGQGTSQIISELPRLTVSTLGRSGSRNGRAKLGERGTAVSELARGCPKSDVPQ